MKTTIFWWLAVFCCLAVALGCRPSSELAAKAVKQGDYFTRSGEYVSAISAYDEAIRIDPGCDRAYRGRGWADYKSGDQHKALADLDRAIQLNPKFAAAYIARGGCRGSANRLDPAIADYTEAIRLAPNEPAAYYGLRDRVLAEGQVAMGHR